MSILCVFRGARSNIQTAQIVGKIFSENEMIMRIRFWYVKLIFKFILNTLYYKYPPRLIIKIVLR